MGTWSISNLVEGGRQGKGKRSKEGKEAEGEEGVVPEELGLSKGKYLNIWELKWN